MNQIDREKIAFEELIENIIKVMWDFSDKYNAKGENCLYPKAGYILVDGLLHCLEEAKRQILPAPARFNSLQIDHICYQIGEWYFMMKPLLEVQHNLGFMKEKLKDMICGNEENLTND